MPIGAILYQDQLARAAEKIDIALTRGSEGRLLAVLDPYNPKGSTRFVNFITSKPVWKTGAQPPKCHISHVVLDSSWEEQLALTLENHPRVLAYAKNQAMGFDIPYLDGGVMRRYVPDFLVRLDDRRRRAAEPDPRSQGHPGRERQGQGADDARSLGAGRQCARRLWTLGVSRNFATGRRWRKTSPRWSIDC